MESWRAWLFVLALLVALDYARTCLRTLNPVTVDPGTCSFINSIENAFFLDATLTCDQIVAGDSEKCTAQNGESFIIDGTACDQFSGNFLISTDDGSQQLNPTGNLNVTCNTGVLTVVDMGGGIETQNNVNAIQCVETKCVFTNSLPCQYFQDATLTCSYIGAAGSSESCTANNGESFLIEQNVCSSYGGDILVDGVIFSAPFNSPINATCVNGVLQLTGGLTDGDVSSLACITTVCSFRTSIPQSNFNGANLDCTYDTGGVISTCMAQNGETFTIRPEACPSLTANVGDFIINGATTAVMISNAQQISYMCDNNEVDTLTYRDTAGATQTVTGVTSIECQPTPSCTFSTNIPTGGFTGHNLDCTRQILNNDPTNIMLPHGRESCSVPYGETFTINPQACPNLRTDAANSGRFLINGATTSVLISGTAEITFECGTNGVSAVDSLRGAGLPNSPVSPISSIDCPSDVCTFDTSVPTAGFHEHNLDCGAEFPPKFDPMANPPGQETCKAQFSETFTIPANACPSGAFLVNGNLQVVTATSNYDCTENGVDTLTNGLTATQLLSIACARRSCTFQNYLPVGSFASITNGCVKCTLNTLTTADNCVMTEGAVIQVHQSACGTNAALNHGFDLTTGADVPAGTAVTITCVNGVARANNADLTEIRCRCKNTTFN